MTNQLVEMKRISPEALEPLVRVNSATCVSIYLPAYHPGSGGVPRTDVLLRSLLDVVKGQLLAKGVAETDVHDLLQPATALSREERMHRGHLESLVIFCAPHCFEAFLLPFATKESVHLGSNFFVLPVLEQFRVPAEYYVLALSRKGARLLHGDYRGVEETKLPAGIPATLEEFLSFGVPDHRRENRSPSGPSSGSMKAVSFGNSADSESHNRYFRDYCVALDRGIRGTLGAHTQPLVPMGAAAEVGIFRGISDHPYLTEPILRSPDDGGLTDEEIPARVWAMLAETPSPQEVHAFAAAEKVVGSALSADELEAIVQFAHKGRVDTVFLCAAAADDLSNAAAIETLRHGGHVWVVPQSRIPGGSAALARLRY